MLGKIVLSLSGGMDSTTLLALAKNQSREVLAVTFEYPSKHNELERAAARRVAEHYKVPLHNIDMYGTFFGLRSSLLKGGGELPEGHYEAPSMEKTVVPGRNMIFASVLAGIAWSEGASEIWLGVHAGDHHIYPDCRHDFIYYMSRAVYYGTDKRVALAAPFLYQNKYGILQAGLRLEVPYHLTRTCYSSEPIACGKCGSCQERLESFQRAGIPDPLEYTSRDLMPKERP